jgi:hypothetical protein
VGNGPLGRAVHDSVGSELRYPRTFCRDPHALDERIVKRVVLLLKWH